MQLKKALFAWAFVCAFATTALAIDTKTEQLVALDAVMAELKTHYGMIKYKTEQFGVTYESVRAKYAALVNDAMTLEEKLGYAPRVTREVLPPDEFRQLLVGLIAEFRDGHLNIGRQSSKSWTVGIYAAVISGRLYVTGFDPDHYVKGRVHPELKVGDEIVAVDGVPVETLAKQDLIYAQAATYRARWFDSLEGLINVSHRWQRPKVDGAPVRITFERPDGGKAKSKKKEDGKKENEADADPQPVKLKRFDGIFHWSPRHELANLKRFRQFVDDRPLKDEGEPKPFEFGVWGHYQSFFQKGLEASSLPVGSVFELGQLLNAQIAEAKAKKPKPKEVDQTGRHEAFEGEDHEAEVDEAAAGLAKLLPNHRIHVQVVRYKGKHIGVLRVPDYGPLTIGSEVQWLQEAIKYLEGATDVLIIDQLTNPGGYVWHFAEIAGLFANDGPMNLGSVEIRMSETFFAAYEGAPHPEFDHEKQTHGQRLVFANLMLHRKAMDTLRSRFDAGERWSGPLAFGAKHTYQLPGEAGLMFARNDVAYTKPILILNDERSGSGGDFFPAAMQANGRAVIFGETSLGLGGPVYRSQASMPGSEMAMRCTYGMCYRADGLPIENVGVVPDILRPTTADDLKSDFTAYAKDALSVAARMASGDKLPELEAAEAKKLAERIKSLPKLAEYDEAVRVLAELREAAATEKDPSLLASRYREGFEALRAIDMSKLTAAHWQTLRFPIPKALATTDFILASLTDGEALEERLSDLRTLPRYAESPLLPLIGALADGIGYWRKIGVSPCLREMAKAVTL